MFRSILFSVVAAALLSSVPPVSHGQESEGFHAFTDKKGQQIKAILLEVSPDKRLMKIRREDGQEFQSEIVALSLDDQQYIKDWMKNRAENIDYRLEVEIERKLLDTEKRRGSSSYYTYEQRFYNYEIIVRNLSRETLPPTNVEYVVVWNDRIAVYKDSEGEWDDYSLGDDDSSLVKMAGKMELESLAYNREGIATSDRVEINRTFYSGEIYREDEPLGIMVRVVSESGTVLSEIREGVARLDPYSWEDMLDLRDPRKMD